MEQLPTIDSSPALQNMKKLFDEIRSDEVVVANGERGAKAARTRLRVALAKMAKLCKEARKEIPPNAQEDSNG